MTNLQWVGLAIVATPLVVIWGLIGRTIGYLAAALLFAITFGGVALFLVGLQLLK